jgi:uncharacterized repeat protein (TIGR01451 family)
MQRFRTSFVFRSRISLVAATALLAGLLTIPALPASAAGPATHFSVVPADSSITSGDTLSFTVTALDDSEAIADGYTGTVNASVTEAQDGETVPQNYTFTGGDTGVKDLSGTLTLAGTRTITVTDNSDETITGSTNVEVTPGDPAKLIFSLQPTNTYSQHTIPVSVKVLDANDNLTDSTDQIQLSANSGDFDEGTNPVAASGGVATFSDLKLNTPGAYSLEAQDNSDEGVTHATSDNFNILAHADIAVTIAASPAGTAGDPAIAGTDEAYTITVMNDGPDMNTSYSVTASIPSGTTLVSAPGCTGTAPITCSGGPLNNGGSDQYVITLHIGSDYAGSDSVQSLSFTANVSLTDPTQAPDNNTSNDTATKTFDVIGQADLSNTLTAPAGNQIAGADAGFDYTLKAKNDGTSDNFGYKSVFGLPTQVSFDSFSTASGGTCGAAGQVITCSNSSLTNHSTDTYTVHAKISPSKAATNAATIATVSSTSTPDPNGDNQDSAQATLHVITRADLSITKTAAAQLGTSNDLAYANTNAAQNRVTFTVTVKNADTSATGPSDAQAVKVTDTPPAGTSFVAAESSSQCGLVSGVVTCTQAAALAPGASRTYTIVVKVSSALRGGETNNFTNTAGVSSTTDDINGGTYPKTATSGTIRVHTVPDAPTNQKADPGNTNAFYQWKHTLSSSTNGGESIDYFDVTVTGASAPAIGHVLINDPCGTSGTQSIFCTNVSPLLNNNSYTFAVRAHNAVGLSDAATDSTTPSVNNSAKQIGGTGGTLTQQTGNGANPTSGDPIITTQTFNSGTAGIGLLQEQAARGNSFCQGKCIGGTVLVNKLEDPNAPTGFYQVNVLYYKSLINGTGIKVKIYFAPNDTNLTGSALPLCPAKVSNITTDCAIVKLGNQGANPALRVIVYTNDVDPTIGGRGFPK